jgi:hypothetical protein
VDNLPVLIEEKIGMAPIVSTVIFSPKEVNQADGEQTSAMPISLRARVDVETYAAPQRLSADVNNVRRTFLFTELRLAFDYVILFFRGED